MVNSLQDITDAWGKWKASQFGTTIWFTDSTDYSRKELQQYKQYVTTAQALATVYGTNTESGVQNPAFGEEITDSNNTTVTQSDTIHCSCSTTDSLSYSITSGLKIGVEISVQVGVPNVESTGAKLSTEVSLSSTQTTTTTEQRTWSLDTNVSIPPDSSVTCQAVVSVQAYSLPFTSTASLQGYVAVWFNNKVDWNHNNDYHQLWFIPITQVFQDVINNNIIGTNGYSISAGQVIATATGTINGQVGISATIKRTQGPAALQKSADVKTVQKAPLSLAKHG